MYKTTRKIVICTLLALNNKMVRMIAACIYLNRCLMDSYYYIYNKYILDFLYKSFHYTIYSLKNLV